MDKLITKLITASIITIVHSVATIVRKSICMEKKHLKTAEKL